MHDGQRGGPEDAEVLERYAYMELLPARERDADRRQPEERGELPRAREPPQTITKGLGLVHRPD